MKDTFNTLAYLHVRYVYMLTFFVISFVGVSHKAQSHEFKSSVLIIEEITEHTYQVEWKPSKTTQTELSQLLITSENCAYERPFLNCFAAEQRPRFKIDNLPANGDTFMYFRPLKAMDMEKTQGVMLLERKRDEVDLGLLYAQPQALSSMSQTAYRYFIIGVEHIVFGFDHLLYVIGLILLVGLNRNLIATITAFTLAHSITLALSVLDLIYLAPKAVEIVIALSIVFVAVEAIRDQKTFAVKAPWLVALLFGLIHGLGFAGALKDIGLPENAITLSLLMFNLGVEIGQLAFVACIFFASYVMHQLSRGTLGLTIEKPQLEATQKRLKLITGYFIGSMGSYWVISRFLG